MVRTKVFVGNLSFKIRENQLVEQFSAAGKVASANIITRGQRSLGYGFVEMESEEEAHRSVELLNKKEIDGRPINVEVAKPREEGAPGSSSPSAPHAAGGPSGSGERHERAPRRRFPRAPRGPAPEGGAPAGAPAGGPAPDGRRRFRRSPRAPRGPAPEGGAPAGERRPRLPRQPRPDQGPRNPSTTTLFVANLPFSVDDGGLANLFQGLNLKSAHVVMKHNGRSKGFGFVEFQNEADQHAALQQVDQHEIEGRKVIVKVALAENRPPAGGEGSSAPEQN